ncbi:Transcriptional regulator, AraC family (plasmid) [Cupriavidus necator H850]|uniref:GlxA family transcriptional regulator n=1 Tax=Cupriavidus necator TaxID=106590 RepID=UPI00129E7C68|nr:AraC family transcriptional regulator [Cupriavidus necator]KAI3601210.1 Transcriptional regulator, AraC family [Cupriavidus necator H850]
MSSFPKRVCLILFNGFQILDVCGPMQVFSSTNELLARRGRQRAYDIDLCGAPGGLIASSCGARMEARDLAQARRPIHTILIPGGPGVWEGAAHDTLVNWLNAAAKRASRVASVCTGAFVLARTGLLDGRQAVTHWDLCERFSAEFPGIAVQPDAIYCRQGRIWTSAGVTAGIDMALAMVEEDLDREVAMAVAKTLVVFYKRPGGQSQFSSALLEQSSPDARITTLHRWVGAHLRERLDVATLAERLSMTPRTFARFYQAQTKLTPARAIEKIRLEQACRLIETRSQSMKMIALACGFSSEEVMRRAFLRILRVSPADYRERFFTPKAGQ